jgi:HrpA-like RNA helicase
MQDSTGELTEAGRKMARLPVDPPLAASLLAAAESNCASDAVAVVSLLSSDRVILTPSSRCEVISFLRRYKASFCIPPQHQSLLSITTAFLAGQLLRTCSIRWSGGLEVVMGGVVQGAGSRSCTERIPQSAGRPHHVVAHYACVHGVAAKETQCMVPSPFF